MEKTYRGSLLVTPFHSGKIVSIPNREEYYCTVNGELHAAQSCINRSISATLTYLPLLVIEPLHRLRVTCFLAGVSTASEF